MLASSTSTPRQRSYLWKLERLSRQWQCMCCRSPVVMQSSACHSSMVGSSQQTQNETQCPSTILCYPLSKTPTSLSRLKSLCGADLRQNSGKTQLQNYTSQLSKRLMKNLTYPNSQNGLRKNSQMSFSMAYSQANPQNEKLYTRSRCNPMQPRNTEASSVSHRWSYKSYESNSVSSYEMERYPRQLVHMELQSSS